MCTIEKEMELFDEMAEVAVRSIAPFLGRAYCDEQADELLGIWETCLQDVRDETEWGELPRPWAREDCWYVSELMDALKGFLIVSMENDW